MASHTKNSDVAAGVLVVTETDDGARFLLIGNDDGWRLPIAVADSVDAAVASALREARNASGLADIAPGWPPVWFDIAPGEIPGEITERSAAGHGPQDRSAQSRGARYLLARAQATDTVAARASDSAGDGNDARWVDLDQGLLLTPQELHAPLVQAAALLMKAATLA
jgi:hypothetical protein